MDNSTRSYLIGEISRWSALLMGPIALLSVVILYFQISELRSAKKETIVKLICISESGGVSDCSIGQVTGNEQPIENLIRQNSLDLANALFSNENDLYAVRSELSTVSPYFENPSQAFRKFKGESRKANQRAKIGSTELRLKNTHVTYVPKFKSWVSLLRGTMVHNKNGENQAVDLDIKLAWKQASAEEIAKNPKLAFKIKDFEVSYVQ